MFGGLAFMVNGHMCCGIVGKDLVVRAGPDGFEQTLRQPHARPMMRSGESIHMHAKGSSRWEKRPDS
jgi:hypothetical protein